MGIVPYCICIGKGDAKLGTVYGTNGRVVTADDVNPAVLLLLTYTVYVVPRVNPVEIINDPFTVYDNPEVKYVVPFNEYS